MTYPSILKLNITVPEFTLCKSHFLAIPKYEMRNDLAMMTSLCIIALLFFGLVNSAPAIDLAASSPSTATPTKSAAQSTATVPFIALEPNGPFWDTTFQGSPQPIRGSLGAKLLGPTDDAIVKENPDLLTPPSADHGSLYVLITSSRGISN